MCVLSIQALKGPHHYQIADHGGLLVAIPADTELVSTVRFSTDDGRCWITYNFTQTPIQFTGLLIEPGNRAMIVAIWGYTTGRIWKAHIVNFSAIIDTKCKWFIINVSYSCLVIIHLSQIVRF